MAGGSRRYCENINFEISLFKMYAFSNYNRLNIARGKHGALMRIWFCQYLIPMEHITTSIFSF